MTRCDAEHRNKRALQEVELAIGNGRIDLGKLRRILTPNPWETNNECTEGE